MRGDHADQRIAHAVELVIIGHVAGANDLDAGLGEFTLVDLLHEACALTRRHEEEERIRLQIFGLLQEGREFRIHEG